MLGERRGVLEPPVPGTSKATVRCGPSTARSGSHVSSGAPSPFTRSSGRPSVPLTDTRGSCGRRRAGSTDRRQLVTYEPGASPSCGWASLPITGSATRSPAALRDPAGPVLPPRFLVLRGRRTPTLRVAGQVVVGPEPRLRPRRVHDAGDVTGRREHEPDRALEQLRGLVRRRPRHDVVFDRGDDVGVGGDVRHDQALAERFHLVVGEHAFSMYIFHREVAVRLARHAGAVVVPGEEIEHGRRLTEQPVVDNEPEEEVVGPQHGERAGHVLRLEEPRLLHAPAHHLDRGGIGEHVGEQPGTRVVGGGVEQRGDVHEMVAHRFEVRERHRVERAPEADSRACSRRRCPRSHGRRRSR